MRGFIRFKIEIMQTIAAILYQGEIRFHFERFTVTVYANGLAMRIGSQIEKAISMV